MKYRWPKKFLLGMSIAAFPGCWSDSRLGNFDIDSVESTAFDQIGYSKDDQALYLEFDNGGQYIYFGVPESLYHEMKDATSVGAFFHKHIRNAYTYERLD